MKLLVAIFVNFSTAPSQESIARIQSVSIPLFWRPVDRWTVGPLETQLAKALAKAVLAMQLCISVLVPRHVIIV